VKVTIRNMARVKVRYYTKSYPMTPNHVVGQNVVYFLWLCQQNCVSQTSNWGNFDGYWKRFCLRETSALSDFCFWAPYKYSATTTTTYTCTWRWWAV